MPSSMVAGSEPAMLISHTLPVSRAYESQWVKDASVVWSALFAVKNNQDFTITSYTCYRPYDDAGKPLTLFMQRASYAFECMFSEHTYSEENKSSFLAV